MDLERYIDEHKEEIIRSVQEIVRIPSVEGPPSPGAPFGEKVDEALRYALALAEKLGFGLRMLTDMPAMPNLAKARKPWLFWDIWM